jgi:hypothetical protein
LTRPGEALRAGEHKGEGVTYRRRPDFVLLSYAKALFKRARLRRYGAGKLTVRAKIWTRSSARGDAHLTIRAMLCAPFRTGTAHIMQLGSVGVTCRGHQSLQPPCSRVAPRQMSRKQHIHDIGIRSNPVRHRTHPVPDCEAKPPKNLDGFESRADGLGGQPATLVIWGWSSARSCYFAPMFC